ncbi:EcKinase domain containing protein, partial [Asbolus verrucosus]
KENLTKLSTKILGNSEKGDGYAGDIIFVFATATTDAGLTKEYNLVLKCSKRSQILRETSPVKDAFFNEIYVYNVVLPAFTQFQEEKGFTHPFDSVPKCYGTFTDDNMEVIVFENLKNVGYSLWDKKKPLTRRHVDMVINEYAKFHAVSLAMQDQNPEKLEELIGSFPDMFKKFLDSVDTEIFYGNATDEESVP